jgi:biopolymer transport protein ExbB
MEEMAATIAKGGWMMAPIGLCSLVALAIIIERLAALRRRRVIDPALADMVHEFDATDDPAQAGETCRRTPGAFSRIIEETIKARRLDRTQIVETMHAAGRTQIVALERGLTILEIVAGISPLLGLMGTVLGMIAVFDAITTAGLGDPQVLSRGISEALITTVAGLAVAIPSLAFHSLLAKRVDDYAAEMQERATGFIPRLLAAEQARQKDADSAQAV